MADTPRNPDLTTLLEVFRGLLLESVRVVVPGQLTDYDATTQRASVQPLVQEGHLDETGERVVKSLPEVHDVPVMFLGPARGRITTPVAVGDTCALWFSAASLARWCAVGGIVDPGDDGKHGTESGAICVVGLHDFAHVPTDAPTDAVVVHASGGTMIKLGSSAAAQAAILGTTYRSAEDTLLTALNTFVVAQAVYNAAVGTALALTGPASTVAAAATTMETAISTFQAAAASYLSSKNRLE